MMEQDSPTASLRGADATMEHGKNTSRDLVRSLSVGCVAFALFSSRMFVPLVWTSKLYVPVVSPIYRQQEHWLRSEARIASVLVHVASGVVMLCIGAFQFDAERRRADMRRHRWLGRVYLVAGCCAVGSLRWLRTASGAGSARHGDPLMRHFIDVASAAWLAATAAAWAAIAIWRDKRLHARCMGLSVLIALVPLFQRGLNYMSLPVAVTGRALVCFVLDRTPPWRARFGRPGDAFSLLGGPLCSSASDANTPVAGARAGWRAVSAVAVDPRACPLVFSFDGLGEAEQAVFGWSAWCGLALALGLAARLATSAEAAERTLGVDDAKLQDATILPELIAIVTTPYRRMLIMMRQAPCAAALSEASLVSLAALAVLPIGLAGTLFVACALVGFLYTLGAAAMLILCATWLAWWLVGACGAAAVSSHAVAPWGGPPAGSARAEAALQAAGYWWRVMVGADAAPD